MKQLLTVAALLLTTVLSAKSIGPVSGSVKFSNNPFTTSGGNSKSGFSSSEYIYGRLEIPSGMIKEVFKIKEDKKTLPFLKVKITILKNGEEVSYGNSTDFILLNDESKNGTALNFDILPEPSKVTTLWSMLDDFSAGLGMPPLPNMIKNSQLPDGDYKVHVKLYYETANAYGSLQDEEKWPSAEGEFDFKFREDDVAKILKNQAMIKEVSVENAFRYEEMPPVFSHPGTLNDPNATAAKITAILKRDLPERQIIKWVAESYSGPDWHIANDDIGIPKYKYFNPHIWMAYKINGKCYIGDVTLRQVYAGGGTYGPLQVAYTSASEGPDRGIDCVKVK